MLKEKLTPPFLEGVFEVTLHSKYAGKTFSNVKAEELDELWKKIPSQYVKLKKDGAELTLVVAFDRVFTHEEYKAYLKERKLGQYSNPRS